MISKRPIGFSRMESQFQPNANPLLRSKEPSASAAMESQFLPNANPLLRSKETIDFSHKESQFQSNYDPFTTSCFYPPKSVSPILLKGGGINWSHGQDLTNAPLTPQPCGLKIFLAHFRNIA